MRKVFLFFSSFFILYSSNGQKKPLDHSVYDSWQSIGERMISNDGHWVVYAINPQEGDNELVIQSSDAKYKKSVMRGYSALITEDSRFVIFKIKPFFKDTRDAKIKKKKSDEFPKDSIGIVELGKDSVWKMPAVKSYSIPKEGSGWVAYQLDKPIDKKNGEGSRGGGPAANNKMADSLVHVIDSLKMVIESMPSKKQKIKYKDDALTEQSTVEDALPSVQFADEDDPASKSSDLVLRRLESGEERTFSNVVEYIFNKGGQKLLMEIAPKQKDSLSKKFVLLYDLQKEKTDTLSRGGNDFRNFTLSDDGVQVAFVAERDAKPKELQRFYKLWYYKPGMDSATMIADKTSVGMQLGMSVSENGNPSFSKNGKKLFFGTAPIQPPKDTTLVDFEHPKLDIWHYKDDYLQTVQLVRLQMDLKQNYLAVFDLAIGLVRQLGTIGVPEVLRTREGDGDIFIGITDYGKRIESQWTGATLKDIYAINVTTGEKKLVKENLAGTIYPSSTGKYIMWYDEKARNYFAWDGIRTINISSKIKFPLWLENEEVPEDPGPYGVMGWHEGDSSVYVYDKYDVWKIDPLAQLPPSNITGGRKAQITYRFIETDPESKSIQPSKKIYFRLFNNVTKNEGIEVYEPSYSSNQVIKSGNVFLPYLFSEPNSIGSPIKAKYSDEIILTKESFIHPPDLYVTYPAKPVVDETTERLNRFTLTAIPLSSINPQQKGYNWGTAELFKWKAYNGKPATGMVFKPENFDASKKYPMICYFYETLSDNLNTYRPPAPIRSAVNISFFVSRGYIIFIPDIHYGTGHPGKDAYDYVVSGARALVKKGFVDSTNMAIQGHSWGGYQVAAIITMTKLFKAAWAGAPVANMTSAYGGIRWESGLNRQFQYEKQQSRIGATLWEKPQLYIANSPLFHLDKVTTPVVIMSNDADGAVPWYQGIEMFTALRRLGKKVWLFNYNGEGHGLTQRQDMRDYIIRMQQFFDWILKGESPPKWITEGLPAVKKGRDWGLE